MMELDKLKGIGPTRLEALRAMGIVSLRDLLLYLPVRYEDMTKTTPCAEAHQGMPVLVEGTLRDTPKSSYFRGISRISASLQDESGKLSVMWYNQPWMLQQLKAETSLMLYGHVSEKDGRRILQSPKLIAQYSIDPVYRVVRGIPGKTFRAMVAQALEQIDDCCPQTLPKGLRMRHNLCELNFAISQAHFPTSMENLKLARRRLAFEQMLFYQAAVRAGQAHAQPGFPIPVRDEQLDGFWKGMPFPPTGAQARVLHEIAQDLRKNVAMSRLVQGDVGCGKTALAFGAICLVCAHGYQAAMMAPTDILARQHYETACRILEPLGVRCGLLVGSLKAAQRRKAKAAIASGEWQAVFGTHALISEDIVYQNLALSITDEQHRFGVRQRTVLQEKGQDHNQSPHVLVMSATPIPRTLALILYGDLDISIVDELPPGRQPVRTRLVPEEKRDAMYAFLKDQVKHGRQGYVVCPLVEESENSDEVRSAKETCRELQNNQLSGLRILLTWGNQPAEEKAQVLRAFSAGEADVLVSTTVIEVGVNVPNATVMIVENAGRFGLSQLHQLRGRVGRGTEESWCFLLADQTEKLRILTTSNDGFEIARKDLELRGPGDLMGTRQSGEAMGDFLLNGDAQLLEETARCLRELHELPGLHEELEQVEAQAVAVFSGRIARN